MDIPNPVHPFTLIQTMASLEDFGLVNRQQ